MHHIVARYNQAVIALSGANLLHTRVGKQLLADQQVIGSPSCTRRKITSELLACKYLPVDSLDAEEVLAWEIVSALVYGYRKSELSYKA